MGTKPDTRQLNQKTTLDQITGEADVPLNDVLGAVDKELTQPLRLKIYSYNTITVGGISVQTTYGSTGHNRYKTIPPINGVIPTFSSGTITISGNGSTGSVTPSAGDAISTLGMSANQFKKIGVSLNSSGQLVLNGGTASSSVALAGTPALQNDTHPIGYFIISTDGGNNINALDNSSIVQYSGDHRTVVLDSSDVSGILPKTKGGTGISSTATFPSSGAILTETSTNNVYNKALDTTNTINVKTGNFWIGDTTDASKQIHFSASGNGTGLKTTLVSSATGTDKTVNLPNANTTLVGTNFAQELTLKTIDADQNTITNIENADIKSGAAIDATKIADGSVTNTEFQYLGNVTSDIQSQLSAKASATDLTNHLNDTSDAHDASAISVSTITNLTATDVQGALAELQGDINGLATTGYVDNAINGLRWKNPVLLATTGDITLSGEQTIDGTLTSGSRVLVRAQSTGSQNGIYVTSSGAWTRATDMDSTTPIDEVNGAAVMVLSGSTFADVGFTQTATVTTLGTDPLSFTQFTSAGSYTYGNGILISGNTISAVDSQINHNSLQNYSANRHIDHTAVSISTSATSGLNGGGDISATLSPVVAPDRATAGTVVAADEILFADVDSGNALKKATAQSIANLANNVTITAGSITGITDLAIDDGGTGASTAAGARTNLLPSQAGNANKFLQTNGTDVAWATSTGGLAPETKSANFTAVSGKSYLVNTSGGAVTATLPAGATEAMIKFSDVGETWDTYNLTITPASGEKIDNLATNESLICDVKRGWVELAWDNVGLKWSLSSLSSSVVPDASASVSGVVNTTTQTFAGNKTFNGTTTLGASGGTTLHKVNGNGLNFDTQSPAYQASFSNMSTDNGAVFLIDSSGGNVTMHGLGGGVTGRRITLIKKNSANTITIKYNSGTASAGNRILTKGAADLVLGSGYGGIDLLYTGSDWVVCSQNSIGEILEAAGTTTSTSTTSLCNVTLSEGTWAIYCTVVGNMSSSAAGDYVDFALSTANNNLTGAISVNSQTFGISRGFFTTGGGSRGMGTTVATKVLTSSQQYFLNSAFAGTGTIIGHIMAVRVA